MGKISELENQYQAIQTALCAVFENTEKRKFGGDEDIAEVFRLLAEYKKTVEEFIAPPP